MAASNGNAIDVTPEVVLEIATGVAGDVAEGVEEVARPLVALGQRLLDLVTNPDWIVPLLQASAILLVGWLLARAARFAVRRSFKHLSAQQKILLQRGVYWAILGLFGVSALRELGFEFGVVLGAAGIVTVAIGFASQTSASNLISGLFLTLERAVEVGDVVRVDGVTGEVLSIDLLSTKIRTFDNLLVRIPNETMVKTQITNLNRFPIRRVDLLIGVDYGSDLGAALKLLREAATKEPLILEEPAPLVIAQGFGDSSVNYQFSVWAKTENFLEVRNTLQRAVKATLDAGGIEIPFPQRTLHAPEGFTVRLIEDAPAPAPLAADDALAASGDPDEDEENEGAAPDEASEEKSA